jgi:hypothetical protein
MGCQILKKTPQNPPAILCQPGVLEKAQRPSMSHTPHRIPREVQAGDQEPMLVLDEFHRPWQQSNVSWYFPCVTQCTEAGNGQEDRVSKGMTTAPHLFKVTEPRGT